MADTDPTGGGSTAALRFPPDDRTLLRREENERERVVAVHSALVDLRGELGEGGRR